VVKALVTGIKGFVGSHLTELLLEKGYEVAGLCTAGNIVEKPSRAYWTLPKEVKLFEADLRDGEQISKIIISFSPDVIFHLAAQSSVKLSFENPIDTFSVNIIGSLNILESISGMKPPPKTLMVASSEIYGLLKPEDMPVTEDFPLAPVNPYGVSKATVDMLGYQYYKSYQLPVYLARAFSHSGPRQRTAAVLSDWSFQTAKIELGLSTPEIKVGNLDVTRDYTDVRDVVKAYLAIIERGKPGKPYNICSGNGYRIKDLLEIITSFSSKKIKVVSDPSRLRPVDIPILIGSPEKIQTDVGWKPDININKTLRDLYIYWIDYLTPQIE